MPHYQLRKTWPGPIRLVAGTHVSVLPCQGYWHVKWFCPHDLSEGSAKVVDPDFARTLEVWDRHQADAPADVKKLVLECRPCQRRLARQLAQQLARQQTPK